jgi:DNA-binding transcriptional MerR regulator
VVRTKWNDGMYSTGEASKYAEFSYDTLQHWLDRAILDSTVPPKGQGYPRRWTVEDIVILRVAKNLKDVDLSLPVIKLICQGLRKRDQKDLAPVIITSEGVELRISLKTARDRVLYNIKKDRK